MHLHKDIEASYGTPEAERNEIDCFHRRYPPNGIVSAGIMQTDQGGDPTPSAPRIQDKLGKVCADSQSGDNLPGLPDQLQVDDDLPSRGEAAGHHRGLQSGSISGSGVGAYPSQDNWQDDGSISGDCNSTPALQEATKCKEQSVQAHSIIESTIRLSMEAKTDLQWWITEMEVWNGKSILPQILDMVMETDASLLGWDAAMVSTTTGGLWSENERSHHINLLELRGGVFAVKTFTNGMSNIHVRVKMDNTTAIAYLNHMGNTRSQSLAQYALQLWQWCLQRGITISAKHLLGVKNIKADLELRTLHSSVEWMLHPALCQWMIQIMGPC